MLSRVLREGRHVVVRQWPFQLPDSWRVELLLAVDGGGGRARAERVVLDVVPDVMDRAQAAGLPDEAAG